MEPTPTTPTRTVETRTVETEVIQTQLPLLEWIAAPSAIR